MSKYIAAAWATAIALLLGLVWWKNKRSYRERSWRWRLSKTLIDTGLIILAAARLPMLLVTWAVLWLIRPIRSPGLKATLGVILGTSLGLMTAAGTGIMEILVIFSAFSIDLITGNGGFLKYWKMTEPKSKKLKQIA